MSHSEHANVEQQLHNAIHISLWTRQGGSPYPEATESLDWPRYFGETLPEPSIWANELFPQLRELLDRCGHKGSRVLALHPRAHISAAMALGYTFRTTTGYQLCVDQQGVWWSTNDKEEESVPLRVEILQSHGGSTFSTHSTGNGINRAALRSALDQHFSESELHNLCFDLSIDYENLPGINKGDKAREIITFVERHVRTADLIQACRSLRTQVNWESIIQVAQPHQLSETSIEISAARGRNISAAVQRTIDTLSLPIVRRVQLYLPESSHPDQAVRNAGHAKAIALQISREVVRECDRNPGQKLHLFASVPVALAVLIGAYLNACPIQCYEHRQQQGDYVPAFLLS